MSKPRLTYFDTPLSRGEECRLALHLAGVDFDDRRLKREEWAALKPTAPFGALPLFELPGKPVLAQSNAILSLIGRRWGLLPKDDYECALHEAMMAHVEDLRAHITPSMRMSDPDEKKRAREQLATTYIPTWATFAERQISDDGPYFGGPELSVADLKLLLVIRWLRGGALDHIPKTVLDPYPKLNRVHDAVDANAAVKAWYAKH